MVFIVLLLIAFVNPSEAGGLVSAFFGGIKTAVSSFADFLGNLFR